MTPGSTTANWLAGSMVLMAVIRSVERTTQPSTALAPPDSPVPAPRVTSGVPVAAQADTTSATSAVVRGRTTAAGYSGLTAITGTAGVAALAATSTSPSAFAAYFTGTTVVSGNFVATGGTKSAAVKDATGQHRLVYCVESPESWFEDFGEAKLVAGKADVKLDPVSAAYRDQMLRFPAMLEWANAARTEPEEVEELDVEF